MDVPDELERGPARGRSAAAAGVVSAVLLGASLRWAHHWGPLADGLVAGWSAATLFALLLSGWSLTSSHAARHLAKLGLSLGLLSVLAVIIAGLAAAAGADPAGACGGG